MLRVIFDTNVYGLLLTNGEEVIDAIISHQQIRVYSSIVIRRELRATPKRTGASRRARNRLLIIHDAIVRERTYAADEKTVSLAKAYQQEYQKREANCDKNTEIDFLIVACATVHGLDILCSNDQRTILSNHAVFDTVNKQLKLRTPQFFNYQEFLKAFLRPFARS